MARDAEFDYLTRLQRAIASLPQVQREIFVANRRDQVSCEEIAARMGLPVRRVERHLVRALYKVALQMEGRKLCWWYSWF